MPGRVWDGAVLPNSTLGTLAALLAMQPLYRASQSRWHNPAAVARAAIMPDHDHELVV